MGSGDQKVTIFNFLRETAEPAVSGGFLIASGISHSRSATQMVRPDDVQQKPTRVMTNNKGPLHEPFPNNEKCKL
jgi:hypothetical protein